MTLTFQQRLQYLIRHGDYDPVLVAAVLGLDLATVEQMMSDPTYEPPSSGGGSRRTIACPFAYNTPNLRTGAVVYTPAIGDILHDAWFEIDTAWDGTTPYADAGRFLNGYHYGWWGQNSATGILLELPDQVSTSLDAGMLTADFRTGLGEFNGQQLCPTLLSEAELGATLKVDTTSGFATRVPPRAVPAKFDTADPVKVVVSQTARVGGADPGSTQGAAVLYLDISTPS